MAESIISEVVSDILEKLGSKAYKKILFAKDLDSHIKRLQQLKTTVGATLLDASSLESCSNAQKDALDKLDCALADLDYFLDATAAKAKQKEIMQGNKFIKEVRLFFSKSNQLVSPFKDAHKIKAIIEKFESISRDRGLVRDIIPVPSVNKTQMVNAGSLWSKCHILTEVVIGRDNDRDKIVNMLLDDSLSSHPLSVASIFGIGGIGKTTLAKYVFNDQRLKSTFDYHLWVSPTQDFDVQKILLEILAAFRHHMPAHCDIVQMYDFYKQAMDGKKLLLVLDNVWDQEGLRQKWLELRSLLALGANGSKVVVTTRNENVAGIMDCVKSVRLGDLTEEHSWLLFQKIAFTQFQESGVEAIGRDIVKMCHNVPLVIRSIGGLLAGKCTVKEWQAFRDDQLANFSAYGRDIRQTLKLSYDQLDERLKLCITYWSLFPKGYQFREDQLIQQWMSLGYIESSYEGHRLEDAAEECILLLTIQGFLTVNRNNWLVMHDLMHDLVVSISDFKYRRVNSAQCKIDERVRHLSFFPKDPEMEISASWVSSIFKLKQLQTLLVEGFNYKHNWYISSLRLNKFPIRILSLSQLGIKKVSSSLGELITLRYLDLSGNPITNLPNSITKLVELLTLSVSHCTQLHKLPKDINKLMNLRHIKNGGCPAPIPKGVASLTELQTLEDFPIEFSGGFPTEGDCGLAELIIIINRLTTKFRIIVTGDANTRSLTADKEEFENECFLESLTLSFQEGSSKGDKMVLEALQPNTNLRELRIYGYKGERLPRWMKDRTHYFENLVDIHLIKLENCRSIGSFGGLLHLKYLHCNRLEKVEYIEEDCCGGTTPYVPLFPSLEELWLADMPKLKTWYKVSNVESSSDSSVQDNSLLAPQSGFHKLKGLYVTNMEFVILMTREFRGFSSLEKQEVHNCEDLKAIPDCIRNLSNLKTLELYNCCVELVERCVKPFGEDWPLIKHIPNLFFTKEKYPV